MKQLFSILVICLVHVACNNHNNPVQQEPAKDTAETDAAKAAYEKWLTVHNLLAEYFDTMTAARFDSLWTFSEPVTRTDSLYLCFPSTDSSYSLVTNMDWRTGKTIFKEKDDVELRFRHRDSNSIFVGIRIPYEHTRALPLRDFFWYNGNTLYILEQDAIDHAYELIRLRMDTDTVWSYRSRKTLKK